MSHVKLVSRNRVYILLSVKYCLFYTFKTRLGNFSVYTRNIINTCTRHVLCVFTLDFLCEEALFSQFSLFHYSYSYFHKHLCREMLLQLKSTVTFEPSLLHVVYTPFSFT